MLGAQDTSSITNKRSLALPANVAPLLKKRANDKVDDNGTSINSIGLIWQQYH